MKSWFIMVILIWPISSLPLGHASSCEQAWGMYDKKNSVEIICRHDSMELVIVKNGCEFPEGHRVDCAFVRSCGANGMGDIGATRLRADTPLDSYCLGGEEDEIFGASTESDPKAHIVCQGAGRPIGIRLNATKNCPFPKFEGIKKR